MSPLKHIEHLFPPKSPKRKHHIVSHRAVFFTTFSSLKSVFLPQKTGDKPAQLITRYLRAVLSLSTADRLNFKMRQKNSKQTLLPAKQSRAKYRSTLTRVSCPNALNSFKKASLFVGLEPAIRMLFYCQLFQIRTL